MTSRSEQIDETMRAVRDEHAGWLARYVIEHLSEIKGWALVPPQSQIEIAEYVATMWAHGYSRGLQRGRKAP